MAAATPWRKVASSAAQAQRYLASASQTGEGKRRCLEVMYTSYEAGGNRPPRLVASTAQLVNGGQSKQSSNELERRLPRLRYAGVLGSKSASTIRLKNYVAKYMVGITVDILNGKDGGADLSQFHVVPQGTRSANVRQPIRPPMPCASACAKPVSSAAGVSCALPCVRWSVRPTRPRTRTASGSLFGSTVNPMTISAKCFAGSACAAGARLSGLFSQATKCSAIPFCEITQVPELAFF